MFIDILYIIFKVTLGEYVREPIEYIRWHSTIMRLSHSFYCYYLITAFIFKPRYSVLIIIQLILITLIISIVIEFVFDKWGIFVRRLSGMEKR